MDILFKIGCLPKLPNHFAFSPFHTLTINIFIPPMCSFLQNPKPKTQEDTPHFGAIRAPPNRPVPKRRPLPATTTRLAWMSWPPVDNPILCVFVCPVGEWAVGERPLPGPFFLISFFSLLRSLPGVVFFCFLVTKTPRQNTRPKADYLPSGDSMGYQWLSLLSFSLLTLSPVLLTPYSQFQFSAGSAKLPGWG